MIAGLDGKLDIVGAARSAHQGALPHPSSRIMAWISPLQSASLPVLFPHGMQSNLASVLPRKSLFMPGQQQRACGVSSPQEEDSAEEESVHTVTSAEALRCQQPHGAIVHSAWWKRLLNEVGLQVKVSSFQREDSGDFPNRHLISLRDTEAGLGDLISMAAIPGGPSPRRSTDAGQRGTAVISLTAHHERGEWRLSKPAFHPAQRHRSWLGVPDCVSMVWKSTEWIHTQSPSQREDSGGFPNRHLILLKDTGAGLAHPGEKTVETSQTGISSHSNSISTHRSWPGPFQREDSGDFPNDLISMAAIPGGPSPRRSTDAGQRGTAVISVTGDLISMAAIPGGPSPRRSTDAGQPGTALISVTAHPGEKTVEISQTGISSHSNSISTHRSWPGPSWRKDSRDFPNWHLIPLKLHLNPQELAWPIPERGQWRLPKPASHPAQRHRSWPGPSQREDSGGFPNRHLILPKDTGAGLAHPRERIVEASQTGISSCPKTQELAWPILEKRQWRLPKLASHPTQTPSQPTGAALGDLISMAAIPGGPSHRRSTDAGQRGTAVISVTGDLISMAAIPGGPSPYRSTDAGQRGTAVISVTGDLISMAAIPGGPSPRRSTDAGQRGTAVISVTAHSRERTVETSQPIPERGQCRLLKLASLPAQRNSSWPRKSLFMP
ncbi:uncharacterized protein [Oryctolagus cuniculus]|uniref:uncharacterized protein isoform X6 n=1 Tax=Oryctolagus cuniculus TaxID=9986 RepID=UPI00387993C7